MRVLFLKLQQIPLKHLVVDHPDIPRQYQQHEKSCQPTAKYNSKTNTLVLAYYSSPPDNHPVRIEIDMDHAEEKGCWTVYDNGKIHDGGVVVNDVTYFKNGFMFIRADVVLASNGCSKMMNNYSILLEFEDNQHLIKLLESYTGNEIPIQYTPEDIKTALSYISYKSKIIVENSAERDLTAYKTLENLSKSITSLIRHYTQEEREKKKKLRIRKVPQKEEDDNNDDNETAISKPFPKKRKIDDVGPTYQASITACSKPCARSDFDDSIMDDRHGDLNEVEQLVDNEEEEKHETSVTSSIEKVVPSMNVEDPTSATISRPFGSLDVTKTQTAVTTTTTTDATADTASCLNNRRDDIETEASNHTKSIVVESEDTITDALLVANRVGLGVHENNNTDIGQGHGILSINVSTTIDSSTEENNDNTTTTTSGEDEDSILCLDKEDQPSNENNHHAAAAVVELPLPNHEIEQHDNETTLTNNDELLGSVGQRWPLFLNFVDTTFGALLVNNLFVPQCQQQWSLEGIDRDNDNDDHSGPTHTDHQISSTTNDDDGGNDFIPQEQEQIDDETDNAKSPLTTTAWQNSWIVPYEEENNNTNDTIDSSSKMIDVVVLLVPVVLFVGILFYSGMVTSTLLFSMIAKGIITLLRFFVTGVFLLPYTKWGTMTDYPMRITAYTVVLVLVASYEISSRTKYIYDDQLFHIMGSLLFIVSWMFLFLFRGIVDLKHVLPLPIVGMLFLSSIDSISSALDIMTTTLVENHTEIKMRLLSSGTGSAAAATKYEVGNELFLYAIQETSMPSFQLILHILILGLLGRMMGTRRHYFLCVPQSVDIITSQMRTVLLIAFSTLFIILLNYVLLMEQPLSICSTTNSNIFSPEQQEQVLAPERFTTNHTDSLINVLIQLIQWVVACAFDGGGSENMESSSSCPLSWTSIYARAQVEVE